ncbi:YdeI/OmpD-associated family protein [Arthrobacter castelli]|uniref:YdeI/OmpD-associated family protein n=1 Tax=Arthrobacter castelli TaxID=271431 RepID=UPI00041AF1A3|nr:YdeI/OmpD-associated family protein [Arthrobacter castelli]
MATELPELLMADADQWRNWLEKHHASSTGVRLVLHKKGGAVTELTYAGALDEALCFGWIDGQAGKRDDGSYLVRFTPRTRRGIWSMRNVEYIGRLETEGRMHDAGWAAVESAKADGRWERAYAGPASAEVPDDLAAAVAAVPAAQAMFDVLTSTNRFALIHRLNTVKTEKTRARKIDTFVDMLARGEAPYLQRRRPEAVDGR